MVLARGFRSMIQHIMLANSKCDTVLNEKKKNEQLFVTEPGLMQLYVALLLHSFS